MGAYFTRYRCTAPRARFWRVHTMRIFFIATKLNFNLGGSMVENDLICRTLQGLGNEVTMLTLFPQYNQVPAGLSYQVIPESIGTVRQLGIQLGVFRLMRKYTPVADAFYVEGQTFLYGAGLYRFCGGRPVAAFFVREQVSWGENVSSFLPGADRKPPLARWLKGRIRWYIERYLLVPFANHIDLLTFDSPLLMREYEAFGLAAAGKSMVIGDPYPFDEVMQKYGLNERSYEERAKADGPVTLFYSGRMEPGKGYDVLLKAFSLLKDKSRFRLVLGGDGSERFLIEGMARELGVREYLEMPGWIPKEKYHESLLSAAVFIHPRWRTAQPSLGLSEAMAFGLPSIVPAHTGLHWVAGKSALPFRLDDPVDLAEKIERLGADTALRVSLSRACFRRLREPDVNYQKTIPAVCERLRFLVKTAHKA